MLRSVFFVIRYWGGYFRPDPRLRRLRLVGVSSVGLSCGAASYGGSGQAGRGRVRHGGLRHVTASRLGYGLLGSVLVRRLW